MISFHFLEIPKSVITISKSVRSAKCEILIFPNFEESTNKILVSEDSITVQKPLPQK
jgi:hypothetical protein